MNNSLYALALALLLIISLPLLSSCKAKNEVYKETRILLGTFISIQANTDNKDIVQIVDKAFLRIEELGKIFTRHQDGVLSKLNDDKKVVDAPLEFISLLQRSAEIQSLSQNAFNPSILPILEYIESLGESGLIDKEIVSNLYESVSNQPYTIDGNNVELTSSAIRLTFDGIAKGFIVDEACKILDEHGIENYLVNAGGDMRTKGYAKLNLFSKTKWRIAIEDPNKEGNYPSFIELENKALATSGSYEKNFNNNLHHIIMPTISEDYTLDDISAPIKSVSVLAPNTMEADALATAFSCMTKEMVLEFILNNQDIACFMIDEENNTVYSDNWPSK